MIGPVFVPDGFLRRVTRHGIAILRSDLGCAELDEFWTTGEALAVASGRGAVRRARIAGVDLVLRDYRRGGLLRRILPDRFLSPRRAATELEVSVRLKRLGVPTIEVLAAVARPRGPLWQLRLATRLMPTARTLVEFAAEHPFLRRAMVRAAGAVVGAAFAAGLRHPDLHPANLLARDVDGRVEVVLIDLDGARLGPPIEPVRRDAMLVRMARWLHRHAGELRVRPTVSDHLRFLAGMGLSRAERRAAWPALSMRLKTALRRRGLAT